MARKLRLLIAAGAMVWCVLLGLGIRQLYAYATEAGPQRSAPARWPAGSSLVHARGATLVMFVHPDCPCSRASVAELGAVLDAVPTATAIVAFVADAPGGELWDAVAHLPRVQSVLDRNGVEAARFGAQTSGQTVAYDAAGKLVFHGGITGSRGHVGDNVGRRALIAQLSTGGSIAEHAVFGCGLDHE